MKPYIRYRRGDVWFLQLPTENGDGVRGSHVIQKSRPYLIVSNDIANSKATTFTVVPITTRLPDTYPTHVCFQYEDSRSGHRNQTILCDQVMTVSIKVFEDSRSFFLYSFVPEMMAKVDQALTAQLGLLSRAEAPIVQEVKEEKSVREERKVHRKGTRWTDDEIKQFISDYEELGKAATAKLYRITPAAAATQLWEFRKRMRGECR